MKALKRKVYLSLSIVVMIALALLSTYLVFQVGLTTLSKKASDSPVETSNYSIKSFEASNARVLSTGTHLLSKFTLTIEDDNGVSYSCSSMREGLACRPP